MVCGDDGSLLSDAVEPLRLNLPDSVGSGLMREQLKQSMRRFCIESEIWRYAFEVLPVVEGERTYRVAEQDDSKVVRVVDLFVACDGVAAGGDRVREVKMPQRKDIHAADVQYWYEAEPGLILLNLLPERDQVLRASVVLRPADGTERMPPEIFEHWRDTIEAGALWKLLMMPAKEWTSVELGVYYKGEYERGRDQAKAVHLQDMLPGRPARRSQNMLIWR